MIEGARGSDCCDVIASGCADEKKLGYCEGEEAASRCDTGTSPIVSRRSSSLDVRRESSYSRLTWFKNTAVP